jgi:hypothetical protein
MDGWARGLRTSTTENPPPPHINIHAYLDVRPRGLVPQLQRGGGLHDRVRPIPASRQGPGGRDAQRALEAADSEPVLVVGGQEEDEVRP